MSAHAVAQEPASQPPANQQKYQWVIEEILAQLKELKRDINTIKRQIQGLGTQVEALAKAQPTGREVGCLVDIRARHPETAYT